MEEEKTRTIATEDPISRRKRIRVGRCRLANSGDRPKDTFIVTYVLQHKKCVICERRLISLFYSSL